MSQGCNNQLLWIIFSWSIVTNILIIDELMSPQLSSDSGGMFYEIFNSMIHPKNNQLGCTLRSLVIGWK